MVSFLWKHNTFLAVNCTLLNNSYVLRNRFIEKQENKNGGKKERRKEERKVLSRTPTRHLRLVAPFPNRYTTKTDCVILVKSILFNAFPMENSLANAV